MNRVARIAASLALLVSLTSAADNRLARAFQAATGAQALALQEDIDGMVVTTTALRIVDAPFGPVLLTKREIRDACHACAGAIGIYYLRKTGGRFTVEHEWPEAIGGWGWGNAPDWSLTDRFTANPAVYAEGAYTGQGITCSGATITELTAKGPVQSDVVRTGLFNGGAITEEMVAEGHKIIDLEGRIAAIRKDRGFEVRATGTDRFIEHYVKRDGKFVLVEPESRLGC